MRRIGLLGIYLCVLATWMQLVAPATALSMDHASDPFSIICKSDAGRADGGTAPDHPSHTHDCCLVCHAGPCLAAADPAPAYRAFEYPLFSAVVWDRYRRGAAAPKIYRASRPRGPPTLV